MHMVKILHSSDWHLGKSLYSRSRADEFQAFLDWLVKIIASENIDIVLVSGDVFDNASPGIRAQELYYNFLHKIMHSGCRHMVVTAGNHDSPAFLSAPGPLLRPLGVHVRGQAHIPEEDVLLLRDANNVPVAVVCAVPYLRDRDIRLAHAGENPEDKERTLIEGIRKYYEAAALHAENIRKEAGGNIPLIGMGHLFAAGGKSVDGDGIRDLYVGSLGHVPASIFPSSFEYLALGHLHVAQKVGGSDIVRYSGSPLPLSFSEAEQEKSVYLLECEGRHIQVKKIPVPSFRALRRLRGNMETLEAAIRELAEKGEPAWLEVLYDGMPIIPDLRNHIEEMVRGSLLEILCVRNKNSRNSALAMEDEGETLADLDREEVFLRRLDSLGVMEEQRPELLRMYREVLDEIDIAGEKTALTEPDAALGRESGVSTQHGGGEA